MLFILKKPDDTKLLARWCEFSKKWKRLDGQAIDFEPTNTEPVNRLATFTAIKGNDNA